MKEHNASAKESPSASRDSSSCGAAEIANAEGNRLYREGNVEAAADAYTTALRESAMPHLRECRLLDTRENNALALLRSKYFANRAQARMQLKDFEDAAQDCRASVGENPANAKALVRWGLCEEALSRWSEALRHFERASTLLSPSTPLLKTALDGARRARTNRGADFKVAHEEAMPQELVHRGQMLRLTFRDPLPNECHAGEWFSVSVGLSNEFGLWRRSDFGRATLADATATATANGDLVNSGASNVSSSSDGRTGNGVTESSSTQPPDPPVLPEYTLGKPKSRLRLVVEACDLEGFGGRTKAGSRRKPLRRGGARERNVTGGGVALPCRPFPISGDARTNRNPAGAVTDEARATPSDRSSVTKAINKMGSTTMRGHDTCNSGRYDWTVETEGEQAIGCDGKTTFRARFVASAVPPLPEDQHQTAAPFVSAVSSANGVASGLSNGGVGGGNSNTCSPARCDSEENEQLPLIVLLRVSVVEDQATSVLGRAVVPVLSLPIRVSSVDDPLQNNSAALSNEDKHKESATEHRALAASAFSAGALSCREAILPLSRVTGVASSRRRSHSWVDPCGCCRDHEATHSTEGAHAADNLRHPGQSCCAISADYSLKGQSEHVKAFESVPRGGNGDGDGDDDCDCVHNDSVSDEKRNAVLEERVVLVAESPGQLGIGGKVWDSAFVLCEYLAQAGYTSCTSAADRLCLAGSNRVDLSASLPNGNEKATRAAADATLPESPTRCAQSTASGLVNGRRVLELGAGTGLVSVCCALLGASAVMATDFEAVTELIRVNMALNLCDTSPGPAPSPVQGSRSSPPSRSPSSTSEARLKTSPSAPTTIEVADPTSKAEEETTTTATAPLESTASGGHVAQRCSSTPAPRTGPAYGNDADSVFPSGDGAIAVATAVPLAWGERSVEVERFRAEVVVMSDVVYDPAGYEPLLETLLDVMQPGMIAIMAHRHRHPEDHMFFARLEQFFCVLEERRGDGSAVGNGSSGQPASAEKSTTSPVAAASIAPAECPPRPSDPPRGGDGYGGNADGGDVRILRIWTR